MKKRLICLAFALLLVLGCTPALGEGNAQIDFRDSEGTIGTWWWNSTGLRKEENVGPRLDFLQANQVNEIYLYAGPASNKATLRAFIERCGEAGIRVACLNGDAGWIDPDSKGFDNWYRWFRDFQAKSTENQRFYGIHLDVEPHQLPRYATEPQTCWEDYAASVARAAEAAHADGYVIELDIPFWLDAFAVQEDGEKVKLLTFLAKRVDTLCLMSYRDTAAAMREVSKEELSLPAEYPVKIILGAETCSEEGGFVSYMEEGKILMVEELSKLYHMLDEENLPSGWGLAVHYVDNWMNLKEQ